MTGNWCVSVAHNRTRAAHRTYNRFPKTACTGFWLQQCRRAGIEVAAISEPLGPALHPQSFRRPRTLRCQLYIGQRCTITAVWQYPAIRSQAHGETARLEVGHIDAVVRVCPKVPWARGTDTVTERGPKRGTKSAGARRGTTDELMLGLGCAVSRAAVGASLHHLYYQETRQCSITHPRYYPRKNTTRGCAVSRTLCLCAPLKLSALCAPVQYPARDGSVRH